MAYKAYTAHDADIDTAVAAVADIPVAGIDSMLVVWRVPGAGAPGDIGATTMKMFTPNASAAAGTLVDVAIAGTSISAATLTGGVATQVDRYDVRGMEKVRLSLTNGAGVTKNLEIHVFLTK